MVQAIAAEIAMRQHFIVDKQIQSIYIGGGTPSLLTEAELALIIQALHTHFTIAPSAEITIEANPDDINMAMLKMWQSFGINRLSVGLQSFDQAELTWMNRGHTAAQSLQCIQQIKASGYSNFSVDLIYGSPLQTNEILKQNFAIIANYNIPHVSCYALTVEKRTKLNKQIIEKSSPDINPDTQANQFYLLLQLMQQAGYEQYEISSFCLPNYNSVHNSSYWQSKPYYGFGPSAHAYNGSNKRRWNLANNSLYMAAIKNNTLPFEEEVLTKADQLNEYVMMALRTSVGIDLGKVTANFGYTEANRLITAAQKYISNKKILHTNTHLLLTTEGKFFADGIASHLFA